MSEILKTAAQIAKENEISEKVFAFPQAMA